MRQAFFTVDLGFGDAGKGSIVDFLTRTYNAHTVIRYNGGAQAGHRVVVTAADGVTQQEHVFAQFGAGTLAGAATHLSRFMLLDPLAMLAEEAHLQQLGITDAFVRTTMDEQALVITPFQRAANRLRELARGAERHGSCGVGIGETMADYLAHGPAVLFAADLANPDTLYRKLAFLRQVNLAKVSARLPAHPQIAAEWAMLTDPAWDEWLMPTYQTFVEQARFVGGDYLSQILQRSGSVIFEGAQGVLLDEWVGFHPYTTWSTTTLANADRLLAEANYRGQVTRIGITRAYATRHGAGPFVTEEPALTAALPDACNVHGPWQQGFRVGWLDLVMLRYACEVVGPLDYLAVTCLDRLVALDGLKLCTGYQCDGHSFNQITQASMPHDLAYQAQLTQMLWRCCPIFSHVSTTSTLLEQVTAELRLPVGLISLGPTAAAKQLLHKPTLIL